MILPPFSRLALAVLFCLSSACARASWFEPDWVRIGEDVQNRGFVEMSHIPAREAPETWSIDTLRSHLNEIEDRPLPLLLGRTLLTRPLGGLKAWLHDRDGLQEARALMVEEEEEDQEGCLARVVKFKLWIEDRSGRSFDAVTDEDLADCRDRREYRWLLEDVFEPVVILLGPELRRAILLDFLHRTHFATVSTEARLLYEEAYEAELRFKREANRNADEDTLDGLRNQQRERMEAYEAFVAPLADRVTAGELPLGMAIGPELWVDLQVDRKRPVTNTPFTERIRINLNTVEAEGLRDIGFDDGTIEELLAHRDRLGAFQDLRDLRRLSCFERIDDARIDRP